MAIYNAPIDEYMFLLDLFDYKNETYDVESLKAIFLSIEKFCQNEYLPANKKGDQVGIKYDSKQRCVKMPEFCHTLYQKLLDTGVLPLSMPEEFGGGGAPMVVYTIINEMMCATNNAFTMGPGLTEGAITAIHQKGSEEIKKEYLPKLISGEWMGTMCLTEPHCGTDLGLIKTKATPQDDHYLIEGTKIWISFGDHDLTENIIHLVLAKLPDAPEGTKGISLFLVPKYLDKKRNNVYCDGLEEKMGIHLSPTCVMNFDKAKGWLVGDLNKGMQAMFIMMNAARVGVGVQGLALADIAYQTALSFAKDRRQSRSLDPKKREMNESADSILVHPDVRRMLLECKATNEAMRALAMYAILEQDKNGDTDKFALLTPIVKSYLTERGCENISTAQQVLGGSGYVSDWDIEQYYRDARISMIYEGTNAIQALDLVGRKLPKHQGKALMDLFKEIESAEKEFLPEFKKACASSRQKVQTAALWLMENAIKDPEEAGAVATRFLNLMAFALMTYMWGLMTKSKRKDKIATGEFFIHHVLPEMDLYANQLKAGKRDIMKLHEDHF
ncbi:MAG: acyl-CoA dehydrogenase [Legionellales bacterium]|nr:acyl-CoA dehydrogenase [Legionellales bacterium]